MHFAWYDAPCVELIATYGQTELTPDVFSQLRIIAILLTAYAITSTIVFYKDIGTKVGWAFQLTLIAATCFFGLLTHHIQLNDFLRPDGIMNTRLIVSSGNKRSPIYTPLQDWSKSTQWVMGERFEQEGYSDSDYRPQCVWLERGVITSHDNIYIEDYHAREPIDRLKLPSRNLYMPTNINGLNRLQKDTLRSIVSKEPMLNLLHKFQITRPLRAEERERFIAQQACLEASKKNYSDGSECIWRFGAKYKW